jgi:hypothetical protein
MPVYARDILKSWFERGDKPTQEQFANLLDSLFHKTEDEDFLKKAIHNPSIAYKQYWVAFKDNVFYYSKVDQSAGAFDASRWEIIGGVNPSKLAGGWKSVATLSDRNSLAVGTELSEDGLGSGDRRVGMIASVLEVIGDEIQPNFDFSSDSGGFYNNDPSLTALTTGITGGVALGNSTVQFSGVKLKAGKRYALHIEGSGSSIVGLTTNWLYDSKGYDGGFGGQDINFSGASNDIIIQCDGQNRYIGLNYFGAGSGYTITRFSIKEISKKEYQLQIPGYLAMNDAARLTALANNAYWVEFKSNPEISEIDGLSAALDSKENKSEKDTANGYIGLDGWKIKFRNLANTFTSFLQNTATAARTYSWPDKDITVAGVDDVATALSTANSYTDSRIASTEVAQGNYDASSNAFPTSANVLFPTSGSALKKGYKWRISVPGTPSGFQALNVGDEIRLLVDNPTTAADWAAIEGNLGYVPENISNKTNTVTGNETSTSLYLSVKGYFDYLVGGYKTFLETYFDTKYKTKIDINDYLTNRSPNVSRIITNASSLGNSVRGAVLGNSIVQGSNATSAAAAWPQQLGGELYNYTGIASGNDWSPGNFGEGGQNILNIAAYLADDGDTNFPQVARGRIYSLYNYFFLMPLRNSTSTLSIGHYRIFLRAIIRQIKSKNMDCIIVTDPPQINQTTGALLDTYSNFGVYKDEVEKIAAEEGASYFDYHGYCVDRYLYQAFDLRTIQDDGTHPGNIGHDEIGNFVFKGLIKPPICSPFIPTELANGGYSVLVSRYNAMSGSPSVVSGLGTPTTPRQLQLNEGSTQAYINSATIGFWSPIPAVGQIMVYLGGTGNTTTVSHKYSSNTVGVTGLTLETAFVRSNYSYALWQKATSGIGSVINAGYSISASGNAQVQGCIFIGSSLYDYQPTVVNGSESGTWSDIALAAQAGQGAGGGAARQSSTIGDSITLRWFGHSLHCELVQGNNIGNIDQVTDGGATTNIVCYSGAVANTRPRQLERNLAEGWHTTVLTVALKSGASTGNLIRIGQFRSFTDQAFSSNRMIYKKAGDVFRVPQSWKNFNIQRVISGAPNIDEVIEGASSITVGGTGVAAIKLER